MRRDFIDQPVDPDAYDKFITAVIAFFNSLPPLQKLSVSGSMGPEIIDAVLARHGPSLVDLKIYPYEDVLTIICDAIPYMPMTITKAQIAQIEANCPVLESLSLYIKRSISDRSEADLYASLARIKPLQFLNVVLDCSSWRVRHGFDPEVVESFSEEDRAFFASSTRLRRGHVRRSFMNCAVDERLARSIWDVIANHKHGKRLLSLKLYTFGAIYFGSAATAHGVWDVAKHLSRSWSIEPSLRDDKRDGLNVRELGLRARKAHDDEMWRKLGAGGWDQSDAEGIKIFREIWPEKEAGTPWMDDWESFPLQI